MRPPVESSANAQTAQWEYTTHARPDQFETGDAVPLTIVIDEFPSAWVLSVSGDLEYSECADFRMQIDRILRVQPPAVVVDFSEVAYIDSSGLGLLLSLSRDYGRTGGRLALVTNETVDRVLEMTRLSSVFTIEADVMSALEHLERAQPAEGDEPD